ncbi:putative Rrp44p protein [Leptomonas pyrrhocoris]|uniref:Putative Rrp44p protein n=1 Tax=Leptomonas pyrrhocoris TaxID=157538 RepID=A0A0N0VHP5_LEPPY|nr:putative Rrp44p protein [Leptomonas pyrrhocoris]KPA85538.1 putative Rrp44p protein [Leptomonas pyrrhocoris]|eukprot:XP_015663977.1 putative Rrp44p protein [Leptomonas pyrrhocoris]
MFTKKRAAIHNVRNNVGSTPSGGVVTRKDIGCGLLDCPLCAKTAVAGVRAACLTPTAPIVIPDTNIVLHNMNALEDARVQNIVFLTTVVSEVENRNKGIYARLQRLLRDESKRCYVFANDRHEQTHCLRKKEESPNDFNDRCIRVAGQWYARHLTAAFPGTADRAESSVSVVSHDRAFKQAMDSSEEAQKVSNLRCVSLRDYIKQTFSSESDLLEKIQFEEPDGMKESPATRQLFTPYLSVPAMNSGIQDGSLFKGKLRVSESSCFFGEIRGKFEGHAFQRIFIPGRGNMNRAIHDDVVAVQLLPVSAWRGPKGAEALPDSTAEEDAMKAGFSPAGQIVGLLSSSRRPFCGSLDEGELEKIGDNTSGSVSILFQPKNNRIPRIRISTRHVQDLLDKRLSVVIDDWPLYSSFPVGHYVEVLGKIGDRDTEATVILLENDVPHYDFSEAVYDCLPKGQWSVTKDEEARRLDLRDLCVVSVDPLGCRDIDDALHCRVVNGNHIEVGVHIADVTHFLRESTAMDEEAAKRSTSVYLVDRRINMLPQLLTENLCSLVEAEDRYAFSILWEFDENLNVVRDWFGKTIIRSRGALYYGDAQRMIDDPADTSEIAVSLRELMRLSQHFKAQREKDGALFLASQEFKFKVDNDHVNPTDMQVYQTFEANSMIEEWMLYANAAAATKVYESYPQWTLLRRHERPAEGAFDALNEALEAKLHVKLDDTSSLTLNKSLDKCEDPKDPYFNKLIRILTTRCLCQAQYFSSGGVPKDEFYHFGLAMPIYTHFTSPIRRYADVVVHRQLAAAIGIASVSEQHMDAEKMENIAENINYRHEQAQRAGRDSQNLFTGFYLRNFENGKIPDEEGYVVRLSDSHVFVLVPKYGQESRIPREQLSKVPGLLDKVMVGIDLKRQGDVMRTKLVFRLIGMMREGEEGGVLVADDEAYDVIEEDAPEDKLKVEDAKNTTATAAGASSAAEILDEVESELKRPKLE